MKIKYFRSASDLHRWLEKNHATTQELWIGYYKKSSGQPSITWPESVDEALCFGWIHGIRKSIDDRRTLVDLRRENGEAFGARSTSNAHRN
jgi:uncharacterized protein YdeI (YjbR/CyaY-like superfamily)